MCLRLPCADLTLCRARHCDVGRSESVVLKDLKDCSVYLLDYSGEVEVTNVQDSQIFIGEWITALCLHQQTLAS